MLNHAFIDSLAAGGTVVLNGVTYSKSDLATLLSLNTNIDISSYYSLQNQLASQYGWNAGSVLNQMVYGGQTTGAAAPTPALGAFIITELANYGGQSFTVGSQTYAGATGIFSFLNTYAGKNALPPDVLTELTTLQGAVPTLFGTSVQTKTTNFQYYKSLVDTGIINQTLISGLTGKGTASIGGVTYTKAELQSIYDEVGGTVVPTGTGTYNENVQLGMILPLLANTQFGSVSVPLILDSNGNVVGINTQGTASYTIATGNAIYGDVKLALGKVANSFSISSSTNQAGLNELFSQGSTTTTSTTTTSEMPVTASTTVAGPVSALGLQAASGDYTIGYNPTGAPITYQFGQIGSYLADLTVSISTAANAYTAQKALIYSQWLGASHITTAQDYTYGNPTTAELYMRNGKPLDMTIGGYAQTINTPAQPSEPVTYYASEYNKNQPATSAYPMTSKTITPNPMPIKTTGTSAIAKEISQRIQSSPTYQYANAAYQYGYEGFGGAHMANPSTPAARFYGLEGVATYALSKIPIIGLAIPTTQFGLGATNTGYKQIQTIQTYGVAHPELAHPTTSKAITMGNAGFGPIPTETTTINAGRSELTNTTVNIPYFTNATLDTSTPKPNYMGAAFSFGEALATIPSAAIYGYQTTLGGALVGAKLGATTLAGAWLAGGSVTATTQGALNVALQSTPIAYVLGGQPEPPATAFVQGAQFDLNYGLATLGVYSYLPIRGLGLVGRASTAALFNMGVAGAYSTLSGAGSQQTFTNMLLSGALGVGFELLGSTASLLSPVPKINLIGENLEITGLSMEGKPTPIGETTITINLPAPTAKAFLGGEPNIAEATEPSIEPIAGAFKIEFSSAGAGKGYTVTQISENKAIYRDVDTGKMIATENLETGEITPIKTASEAGQNAVFQLNQNAIYEQLVRGNYGTTYTPRMQEILSERAYGQVVNQYLDYWYNLHSPVPKEGLLALPTPREPITAEYAAETSTTKQHGEVTIQTIPKSFRELVNKQRISDVEHPYQEATKAWLTQTTAMTTLPFEAKTEYATPEELQQALHTGNALTILKGGEVTTRNILGFESQTRLPDAFTGKQFTTIAGQKMPNVGSTIITTSRIGENAENPMTERIQAVIDENGKVSFKNTGTAGTVIIQEGGRIGFRMFPISGTGIVNEAVNRGIYFIFGGTPQNVETGGGGTARIVLGKQQGMGGVEGAVSITEIKAIAPAGTDLEKAFTNVFKRGTSRQQEIPIKEYTPAQEAQRTALMNELNGITQFNKYEPLLRTETLAPKTNIDFEAIQAKKDASMQAYLQTMEAQSSINQISRVDRWGGLLGFNSEGIGQQGGEVTTPKTPIDWVAIRTSMNAENEAVSKALAIQTKSIELPAVDKWGIRLGFNEFGMGQAGEELPQKVPSISEPLRNSAGLLLGANEFGRGQIEETETVQFIGEGKPTIYIPSITKEEIAIPKAPAKTQQEFIEKYGQPKKATASRFTETQAPISDAARNAVRNMINARTATGEMVVMAPKANAPIGATQAQEMVPLQVSSYAAAVSQAYMAFAKANPEPFAASTRYSPIYLPISQIYQQPTILQEATMPAKTIITPSTSILNMPKSVQMPIEGRLSVPIEKGLEIPTEKEFEIPVERELNIPIEKGLEIPTEKELNMPIEKELNVPIEKELNVPIERELEVPIEKELNVPVEINIQEQLQKQLQVQEELQLQPLSIPPFLLPTIPLLKISQKTTKNAKMPKAKATKVPEKGWRPTITAITLPELATEFEENYKQSGFTSENQSAWTVRPLRKPKATV